MADLISVLYKETAITAKSRYERLDQIRSNHSLLQNTFSIISIAMFILLYAERILDATEVRDCSCTPKCLQVKRMA